MEIAFFGFGWFSNLVAGLFCAGRAYRNSYPVAGLALLGLALGWGAIPLALLITREVVPVAAGLGEAQLEPGFNPVERAEPRLRDEWAEWSHFYLVMRQQLVIASVLTVAVLPLLCLLFLSFTLPSVVMVSESASFNLPRSTELLIFITQFSRTPVGFGLWCVSQLAWPTLLYRLLLRNYRFPFLGRVWRHADQIWLLLERRELPREVAWCTPDLRLHATDLPSERARLHAALKRCPVLRVAALSFAALLGLVILLPLVLIMLVVRH